MMSILALCHWSSIGSIPMIYETIPQVGQVLLVIFLAGSSAIEATNFTNPRFRALIPC